MSSYLEKFEKMRIAGKLASKTLDTPANRRDFTYYAATESNTPSPY